MNESEERRRQLLRQTRRLYNEDSFILAYLSNERKFDVRDQNIILLIKIGLAFFKTIR